MIDDEDTRLVPPRPAPDSDRARVPDIGDTVVSSGASRSASGPAPRRAVPSGVYGFRIGAHAEVIPLDRPVYIGRRPTVPRVPSSVLPRLVRVPSPLREVSGTHLEVHQLGSSVIVTDLRTTNGTVVMLPGSVPRKLLQGESVVVSPGTLVDIGDENILQILPMQRLGEAGRQQ